MENLIIEDKEFFAETTYMPRELCTVDRSGVVDDVTSCREYCEDVGGDCTECVIQRCFERLSEYEVIGLTPDQIREVDKLYAEKCREVADLQKSAFSGMEMLIIWEKLQKLKEYQRLEAEGLLIRIDKEAAGIKKGNE